MKKQYAPEYKEIQTCAKLSHCLSRKTGNLITSREHFMIKRLFLIARKLKGLATRDSCQD